MLGNRGFLLFLSLIGFLIAAKAPADVSEDANRLLDWAEIHYPTLFSPAKQPTQEALGYIYRYYPNSKNYAGVHIVDGTAHVLGPDFGDGILNVGTLEELMKIVNSDPSTSGSGACVTVPLYVEGARSLLVTFDNTGKVIGTTERLIESVTKTTATFSETLGLFDTLFQGAMQRDHQVWFHLAGNNWHDDAGEVVTSTTLKVLGTTETFVEVENVEHGGQSIIRPNRLCVGDWWEDDGTSTCRITVLAEGRRTTSNTNCRTPRQIVEAVNVPIVLPAGNFNTVRTFLPGTNTNGESYSDRQIVYYDVDTGTIVLQQHMELDGTPRTVNVLESFSME